MTTTYAFPQFELPSFVARLGKKLGSVSASQAIEEIRKEIEAVERSPSRDARIRFDQMRYSRSLARLLGFLTDSKTPPDMTPKETSALQDLCHKLDQTRTFKIAAGK